MAFETLRGRYRLHRFPPLQRRAAVPESVGDDFQRQLRDGFQEGLQRGYEQGMKEGHDAGYEEGQRRGHDEGARAGYAAGSLAGQREGLAKFTAAADPLDNVFATVNDYLAHLQRKQRADLLQLVEKVTRQVIRCELALQPTQLLALVEEAVAALPAAPETLRVLLNAEEFQRIQNVAPDKAAAWGLTPSADLPAGECRVVTDTSELDIGCGHRLEQCMGMLKETLTPETKDE